MKVKTIAGVLAAMVIIGVAVALHWGWGDGQPQQPNSMEKSGRSRNRIERRVHDDKSAKESVRQAMTGRKSKPQGKVRKRVKTPPATLYAHLKGKDRVVADAMQSALDDNDYSSVVKSAEKASKSSNPEVRQLAVEALGWFGADALPELTVFMGDPDEDVASAAADQWEQGLCEIEEDDIRIATAEAAMRTINHEDAMRQIVTEITGQADELKIMQSLVDIIDSGNRVGVEIAKEEYETLTGEEWAGIEAAEAWLDENYEPEASDGQKEWQTGQDEQQTKQRDWNNEGKNDNDNGGASDEY